MFYQYFEKTALETSTIARAFKGAISRAKAAGGNVAGAAAIRNIEAKSAKLGEKGMMEAQGQRGEALRSLLPKPAKEQGNVLDYSKFKASAGQAKPLPVQQPASQIRPSVFEQNKSTMLKRNTPYSQV